MTTFKGPSGYIAFMEARAAKTVRKCWKPYWGSYLDEMGVDRRILDAQAFTGPTELKPVSLEEARQWQLDNSIAREGRWELKTAEGYPLTLCALQRRPANNGASALAFWRSGESIGVELIYWPHVEGDAELVRYRDSEYLDTTRDFDVYIPEANA